MIRISPSSARQWLPGVALAALTAAALCIPPAVLAQQSTAQGIQKRLGDLFSDKKEEQLLEPDQAFQLKLSATGPATIVADLMPARGYYLYRERVRFAVKNSPGVAIRAVSLPAGKVKNDPNFGRMEIYYQPVRAEIALERAPSAKAVTLVASYQGCNEPTGVCYPPVTKEISLTLP